MSSLLIAGTDTNVGKTVLTSSLVISWLHRKPKAKIGLMKLMQTGIGDRELYQELFSHTPQVEITTPLEFTTPVAPPLAAVKENKEVDLALVSQSFQKLKQTRDLVIVEGIGGLGTPLTFESTVADLAREWEIDTVLVVPVKLGAIAQTIANVMYARYAQVKLKGIILSCTTPEAVSQQSDWAPIDLIESLTDLPILTIIPYLDKLLDLNTPPPWLENSVTFFEN
jgi:dethiobiotin synthetase